jgi:hypothetical protein
VWYVIKPVQVSIDVRQPRATVYDFLDVMANHECFTDHALTDWTRTGPDRGVGSKARVTARTAGRSDTIEIEVIAAEPPAKIVEQNIGAKGRRVASGTYLLEDLPSGGTHIAFEYAWQHAPLSERLAAPFARATVKRINENAMRRLADRLTQLNNATTSNPSASS